MPSMSALPHPKSFNRRLMMEKQTEIKKFKDQIEELIMEIILSVLVRLKNEMVLEKKKEMKF
jgi:hypothetical protein